MSNIDKMLIIHFRNIKSKVDNGKSFKTFVNCQVDDNGNELSKKYRLGYAICESLCYTLHDENYQYEIISEKSFEFFDKAYKVVIGKNYNILKCDINPLIVSHKNLLEILDTAIKLIQNQSFL
jgi:hypothetical protein